ncbi:recombinase family protein, partial [Escherichia coli]|uniref:recombinase family protein n=1 Tax=Escherichia coli TaxID=562 RepID=UPI001953B984
AMTDAALRVEDTPPVMAIARAALYLRVSTGRQAESDLSIPDQRRQIEGYCLSRGWEVAAEFVGLGLGHALHLHRTFRDIGEHAHMREQV